MTSPGASSRLSGTEWPISIALAALMAMQALLGLLVPGAYRDRARSIATAIRADGALVATRRLIGEGSQESWV